MDLLFDIIEIYIRAFIHNPNFADAFNQLKAHIDLVWLGATVVICVSFLPFFAMKEVSRVMGPDKFRGLFFNKQLKQENN